jgi:AcrR family transcriptional regulator
MSNARLPPKDRTKILLDVATKLAAEHGWLGVTRQQIAHAADVSPALVSARLGTMENLRRSVMRHAIATEALPIIAEGLVARDRLALKAPQALRDRAVASIGRTA